MPKRTSFPSMLPPGLAAVATTSIPRAAWIGLPPASAQYATPTPPKNSANIAAQTAQPWRWWRIMRPSSQVRADGMRKIANIDQKLVHGVGFSNGCAELALKKPPPLVPSCLIASWLATGPMAIVCLRAFERRDLDIGLEVLDDALLHEDQRQ